MTEEWRKAIQLYGEECGKVATLRLHRHLWHKLSNEEYATKFPERIAETERLSSIVGHDSITESLIGAAIMSVTGGTKL